MDEGTEDLILDLPDELYERLKARAARHSKTPEEYLRDLIEETAARPD